MAGAAGGAAAERTRPAMALTDAGSAVNRGGREEAHPYRRGHHDQKRKRPPAERTTACALRNSPRVMIGVCAAVPA